MYMYSVCRILLEVINALEFLWYALVLSPEPFCNRNENYQ